jgi:hypothetical protein
MKNSYAVLAKRAELGSLRARGTSIASPGVCAGTDEYHTVVIFTSSRRYHRGSGA